MKSCFLALVLWLCLGSHINAQNVALLLFDGETGRKFAGCLNCNRNDEVSVCNRYGTYGSKYEDESIWNSYGIFGSKYEDNSPWNKYGEGLRVVDPNGNFYGHFSLNKYASGGQSKIQLIQSLLRLYEANVEPEAIRNLLCED